MTIVGGDTWTALQARRWARTGSRSGRGTDPRTDDRIAIVLYL